jgi:hypothetical protein
MLQEPSETEQKKGKGGVEGRRAKVERGTKSLAGKDGAQDRMVVLSKN